MKQIPILEIVKQSLTLPFSQPVEMFKALGLIVLSLLIAIGVMMLAGMVGVVDVEALRNVEQAIENGQVGGLIGLLPVMLIAMLIVVTAFAYIFNFWVRAGAFGPENAKIRPMGKAFSAASVNMLKFIFIGIILVIAAVVVMGVLSMLGLSGGFGDQMQAAASQDIAAATRAGLMNQIVMTIISCIVYSLFSANLTQTAVGSDREGLKHPHNVDFAIVLFLLYAVLLVPTVLAGLIGSMALMQTLNIVLGLYITFSIGIAHGIRYRICVAENEQKSEE